MVSEQFVSGRMPIQNELSQSEEWESNEDLEYVDTKLEKIQEHFGSINKYLQTIMKKLDQLIKSQDDNLKKMSPDDSDLNSNTKSDPNLSPDVYPDPCPKMNPKPDPNSNPSSDPDPNPGLFLNSNLYPNPDSKIYPKSDPNVSPKLNPNLESGMAMNEQGIEGEHSDVKGDGDRNEKKEKNRREISDEDRPVQNLGRATPLMSISQQPPPFRSSSLPALWSNCMLFLSSLSSSENVAKTVEKMSTGSGNLFRIERALKPSKPNLVILCRPNLNPNPELVWTKALRISIWPKPVFCAFSDRNKGLLKIIRVFISSKPASSMEKGEEWLAEGHWKLPPPWPPPLLPFSLLPPLPQPPQVPNAQGFDICIHVEEIERKDPIGEENNKRVKELFEKKCLKERSPAFGRNNRLNEWSTKKLARSGIERKIKESGFGLWRGVYDRNWVTTMELQRKLTLLGELVQVIAGVHVENIKTISANQVYLWMAAKKHIMEIQITSLNELLEIASMLLAATHSSVVALNKPGRGSTATPNGKAIVAYAREYVGNTVYCRRINVMSWKRFLFYFFPP